MPRGLNRYKPLIQIHNPLHTARQTRNARKEKRPAHDNGRRGGGESAATTASTQAPAPAFVPESVLTKNASGSASVHLRRTAAHP